METYKHSRKIGIITLLCLLSISLIFSNCKQPKKNVNLSIEEPGSGYEDNTLFIAAPLLNNDSFEIRNVTVTSVHLEQLAALGNLELPIVLGNIDAGKRAIIQTGFSSKNLSSNTTYHLFVEGTCRIAETEQHFLASRVIKLPPHGNDSAMVGRAEVHPKSVKGAPYSHQENKCCNEVNKPGPPTPIGVLRGTMQPSTSPTTLKKVSDLKKINFNESTKRQLEFQNAVLNQHQSNNKHLFRLTQWSEDDFVFITNTHFGVNSFSTPFDPSGASGGQWKNGPEVVLASGNTYASLSINAGMTFTQLDPTTIFPNGDDGGICCDQVIHYSNSVNRFFWLMQFNAGSTGSNRLRLASASPEDLVANSGTAWTYWDLTSATFNLGTQYMDYPDLSVGNNYLYVSVDASPGLLVARIPLSELANNATIHIDYTQPTDNSTYGVHIIQNPGDEIFWAGHPTNSLLRIYSIKEGSNKYYWRDVKINSYPTGVPSSISPDGSDWLASFFSGGPGGVRVQGSNSDELWFEWYGIKGGGFPQTHVQIAKIRHSDFSLINQTQIWNQDFAFAHASFALCNHSAIGVAIAFGGGQYYGSPAVGILGDNVFYCPVFSEANRGRYGDYSTIRSAFPNSAFCSATMYAVNQDQSYHPIYVLFGRRSALEIISSIPSPNSQTIALAE